jgi:hypothetical protein
VYNVANGPPTVDLQVKEVPFVSLYTRPPDDGLQMGPKNVDGVLRQQSEKQCIVLVYCTNIIKKKYLDLYAKCLIFLPDLTQY